MCACAHISHEVIRTLQTIFLVWDDDDDDGINNKC